ncbi:alkene reductase [Paraburkholderia sp. D1E]|uniref:alkene reductase n=1 Tax=Paraburkholderia sp. D1E TaxID=3461398 RepID=UPI004046310B
MFEKLLSPVTLGAVGLPHRVVMAPLTRSRASQPGDVPNDLNAEYYRQRSSAALIISEATCVSRQGRGYSLAPGMYSDEQEAGWRNIVETVHREGGRIAMQLWHVGRISHCSLLDRGEAPVAPSAIRASTTKIFVVDAEGQGGMQLADAPRALETSEIPEIISQHVRAAERCKRAGFDMVELHGANGYLLHQFMSTNTNTRTDRYGGSLANRARFTIEVLEAVCSVFGANRVGLRLSPNFTGQDMADTESEKMALFVARELSRLGGAYLHIAEPDWLSGEPLSDQFRHALREAFNGSLVVCGNYTAEAAEARIASGLADAAAFGRPFIANPDLVERFRRNATLSQADRATYYGGDGKGYTDYPTLAA